MMVGELMKTDVAAVTPGMSWREAATLLYARHVSSAPVVDEKGYVVGVLSEKTYFVGYFPVSVSGSRLQRHIWTSNT